MKSEKGITMISLVIYVIAMLITVTIITIVTSYFYKNVDITAEKYTYYAEFTRGESYFTEESNIKQNRVIDVTPENEQASAAQIYIVFKSGNQYTYIPANKAIYQNNIKIVSGVEQCTFKSEIKNGKQNVTVTITIQGKTRTITYILQN